MRDPLQAALVLVLAVFPGAAVCVDEEEQSDAESLAAVCATEPGEAGVAACRRAVELEYFELGRPFPASPEAHGRLGEALGQLGRWDEACRVYREMIRLDRENPLGHYRLGVTLLEKLDRAEEAIGPLIEATRRDSTDAAAQVALGTAMARIGRHLDSLEHFEAAARLAPKDGRVHQGLADSLLAIGRVDEAVIHYRIAARSVPEPGFAYLGLGRSLLRLGRFEDAVEAFRSAAEKEPFLAEAYGGLGGALNRLGQFKEAVEALETAESLDRNYFSRYPEQRAVLDSSRNRKEAQPN